MGTPCHYVLIEASGKQSYIFETNRRRENVGASELIYRLGSWVEEALWGDDREEGLVPGFDGKTSAIAPSGGGVQLISAAGGSVKLLVADRELGVKLVTRVTAQALREAPGLDVCGYVDENSFDWDAPPESEKAPALAQRMTDAGAALGALRAARPAPETRFLRLPIVDECAVSGLPAADLVEEVGEPGEGERDRWKPRSLVSLAKDGMRDEGYRRFARVMTGPKVTAGADAGEDSGGTGEKKVEAEESEADAKAREKAEEEAVQRLRGFAEELGDSENWVAVIHADVNDLGTLFHQSRKIADGMTNNDYAVIQRELSQLVDRCTVQAFQDALAADGVGPDALVLPLVLGGDDLTLLCEGSIALRLTVAYLDYFERRTRDELDALKTRNKLAARLAAVGGRGWDGLTACAGVALVKPHFPFSAAYKLAEDLTDEAKKAVKAHPDVPVSALSFHILYDSGSSGLRDLRARQSAGDGHGREVRLVAQPYVTTPREKLAELEQAAQRKRSEAGAGNGVSQNGAAPGTGTDIGTTCAPA